MKKISFTVMFLVCQGLLAAEFEKHFSFGFDQNHQGWVGGFADYPKGDENPYQLAWGWEPLPLTAAYSQGLKLSGINRSDDLFMFIKRKISGLSPLTEYSVSFKVSLQTNAPKGCIGVGGAPGESVFLKAGAYAIEPESLLNPEEGFYRMNLDKGNQSEGGSQAIVLGTLENTQEDCHHATYEAKQFTHAETPFTAKTDKQGEIWIFLGTDSGFESRSTYFIESVDVVFAVDKP